jgi:uncharacterized membrane protein YhaH (DUF805 family)
MTDIPPPPPPASYGGGGTPLPTPANPLVSYWKKVVLENYANFSGRARRAEFWWYFLANIIISIVLNIIDLAIGVQILTLIYSLAVLIPGLAVGVRRLHDTNKSGWRLLIGLIPIVGIIVLIVFWATDAPPGPNQYGPSEKYA